MENNKKKSKFLLYISTFRPIIYELLKKNILFDNFEEKFEKKYKYHFLQGINFVLPRLLKKYCEENNLQLKILGATKNKKRKYFTKVF